MSIEDASLAEYSRSHSSTQSILSNDELKRLTNHCDFHRYSSLIWCITCVCV